MLQYLSLYRELGRNGGTIPQWIGPFVVVPPHPFQGVGTRGETLQRPTVPMLDRGGAVPAPFPSWLTSNLLDLLFAAHPIVFFENPS